MGRGKGSGSGHGEGSGSGHGEGQGQGKGESDENIIIGSAVAIGLTVFMCVCGIPMILAGIVMVAIFEDGSIYTTGIVLLVISALFLVGGIVFIILICTGVIGQKRTTPTAVNTATVVMVPTSTTVHQVSHVQQPMNAQPGYPQPQGYPPQGYPQQGYPPQGYPPQGQMPPFQQQPYYSSGSHPAASAPPQGSEVPPPYKA